MSGGILTGHAIRAAIEEGDIDINPYCPEHLNAASIDICLGDKYSVYRRWVQQYSDDQLELPFYRTEKVLDVCNERHFDVESHVIPKRGLVVQPNILYLMHTHETVHTKKYEPVLDGKSSIGRLGLFIHVTAAYGDPGFDGNYTLEVMSIHPVRIFAGMRIGQMRFHTLVGPSMDYQELGNYVGADAVGPVPSKAHRQFKREG